MSHKFFLIDMITPFAKTACLKTFRHFILLCIFVKKFLLRKQKPVIPAKAGHEAKRRAAIANPVFWRKNILSSEVKNTFLKNPLSTTDTK